jgi:meiotic recombination protein SPO11
VNSGPDLGYAYNRQLLGKGISFFIISKKDKHNNTMSTKKRSRSSAAPTIEVSTPSAAGRRSTAGKNRKREVVKLALDADLVLAKCRALKATLRNMPDSEANTSLTASGSIASDDSNNDSDKVPNDIVEVDELSATEVLEGIEGVALRITQQVLNKKGFSMEIPSRSASNQIYIKEWDRIVLGGKKLGRNFMNVRESRKSAITLRVMQLLHAVLMKRIHITKRDLFYTDVKLFVDQADSDGVLDDVATMIGCTRSNLHVVASDKGLVVGRIQFEEDGDYIDCTKMGVGGKAIPPYIDKIENIKSDAEFILLVEKEAAYMRMAVRLFSYRCSTTLE